MMQCRDIDDLMVEFLYQELEGEQLAAFQKHVDGCARCGAEMKSLVRTRQALRALPEAEPSPAVSARLLHEAAKRAAPAERGGILAWFGKLFGPLAAHPAWAAAASLLLVAGVAGFLSVRAKMDGQLRQEAPASETVAAAPATPAPPAPDVAPPPRDVSVGGDGLRARDNEAPKLEARAEGLVEEEKAAAGKAAKEVRAPGDKAPDPYPRKVAAGSYAAGTKKSAASSDDGVDRTGRTASAEEDGKLAEPAAAAKQKAADLDEVAEPGKLQAARPKAAPASNADFGGVAASPPPPPPPAPEQAQRETEASRRADSADQRGGRAKGEADSAGAAAGPPASPPATSTPAPAKPAFKDAPSAPAEQERVAAPAETTSLAKRDAKPTSKLPPEQELLQLAQKQATTGRCAEALGNRDRIERMNPEFFRKRVAGDASLRSCEEQNKKNRAPARAVKQPAADEAASEKVTK